MYSHEIQELLRLKNNLITVRDYLRIIESPQINNIKFDNEKFYIYTNDGYNFAFKVKYDIINKT